MTVGLRTDPRGIADESALQKVPLYYELSFIVQM